MSLFDIFKKKKAAPEVKKETAKPKKLNNFFLTKNYNFIERLSDFKFKKNPEYGDYLYKNCSF